MMYEQTFYKSMRPGHVYLCPPGGTVALVVDNEHHEYGGYITFLVLNAGSNVNWHRKEGLTVRELYSDCTAGSWTRVS